MAKKKIHDRHMRAIDLYFENGFVEAKALRGAGFSASTAADHPEQVFGRPEVKAEIERRKQKLAAKHELTQDWIVNRLRNLATAGDQLAKFKIVQPDGLPSWDFTGATEAELALIIELGVDIYTDGRGEDAREVKKFRVKFPDEYTALMALGRHLGIFTDNINHTGDLAGRIQAGRDQAYNRPLAGTEEEEDTKETLH